MGIFDMFKKSNKSSSVQRVNWDEITDVGIVSHYRGKPFTGVCFSLHSNGYVEEECEMLDGLKHGLLERFNDKGVLIKSINYQKDIINGTYISYHSNGKISSEGKFENGEEVGIWKSYDENGNLDDEGDSEQVLNNSIDKLYHSIEDILDLDLGPEPLEKLKGKTLMVDEDGVLPKDEEEIKVDTDDLPESPVKSIDDLDLDPETMEKLKSMTVQVGEDGVLPGIDFDNILTIVKTEEEILKLTKDLDLVKNINLKDGEDFNVKFLKYSNDQIQEIGCVINNIRIGKWIQFYENGKIKRISNYNKEGYSVGEIKYWDEDGNEIDGE